ncbi:MAG TPA: hypothetical protein VLJ84_09715 [Usitatibacter sp.]|nr:hypothetical protein [Usitatibacter sp.]
MGSITTLAILLLVWPLISMAIGAARKHGRRAMARSVEPGS